MGPIVGWIAYLFTLLVTFLMLSAWPVIMLSLLLRARQNRRRLAGWSLVGAAFAAGAAIAWFALPVPWDMPLWETAYASVRSDIYGHPLESQAERILLFVLFAGSLAAVATGLALLRHARRPALAA